MSTATLTEPRVRSVNVTDEAIVARLVDGRSISVPLDWSWRLSDATPQQRSRWEIIGDGQGIRWPDVDEDISVEGMLRGVPAKRPARSGEKQIARRKQVVSQKLRQNNTRLEYFEYLKWADEMLPEPMTFRQWIEGVG